MEEVTLFTKGIPRAISEVVNFQSIFGQFGDIIEQQGKGKPVKEIIPQIQEQLEDMVLDKESYVKKFGGWYNYGVATKFLIDLLVDLRNCENVGTAYFMK
jgi:hypothetical protein